MDIFEKLGDAITTKGQAAVDKAKEWKMIAELRSQIAVCEEVIRKNYLEIGQKVYEQRKETITVDETTFEKQFRSIENARRGREELKRKIEEIKNPGMYE